MTERLHFQFSLSCTGEGNGNPLQCSCLENPRDRGVWWAAVYGVSQSQTRLKRLSSSSSRCFPGDSVVKNLLSSAGDLREVCLIPGSGRSPERVNGNSLQYSCLENSMDREVSWATVHGVTKSRTWLSGWAHTYTQSIAGSQPLRSLAHLALHGPTGQWEAGTMEKDTFKQTFLQLYLRHN